jgi:two-component system OmpR family response regulator
MPPLALRNILLVDDDPDIRRIAALSLDRIGGFHVTLAANAKEALEQVTRSLPDLILLDVSMPDVDGPEILAALRSLPLAARVPVVFLTAGASEPEVLRLLALGALGVIAKPFDLRELPARVRDMFALAQLE